MKFSENAYQIENVRRSWRYFRWIGSCFMYSSGSWIQPMFHFMPKPRPPEWTADHRARSRFFSDHLRVGVISVNRFVELAQELDRAEIFSAAMDIGKPLALLASVIEVQHRRNGVDAQSIDVVFREPEPSARRQESADFVALVVEDQALPLRVESLTRIRVLVKVGSVEAREAMRVIRKVRRHPVENHADAPLGHHLHQGHQVC